MTYIVGAIFMFLCGFITWTMGSFEGGVAIAAAILVAAEVGM